METLVKTNTVQSTARVSKKLRIFTPEFVANTEAARFGIVPAILTIVTCLSAFAAAFAAQTGMTQLILVGLPTGVLITTIIAVSPMRVIFTMGFVAMIIDLVIIFINVL